MKLGKLAKAKPKKKCCRSDPRCKRCPLVIHQLRKAEAGGLHGKELAKVFREVRRNPARRG